MSCAYLNINVMKLVHVIYHDCMQTTSGREMKHVGLN